MGSIQIRQKRQRRELLAWPLVDRGTITSAPPRDESSPLSFQDRLSQRRSLCPTCSDLSLKQVPTHICRQTARSDILTESAPHTGGITEVSGLHS
jgi:hypothetical protein